MAIRDLRVCVPPFRMLAHLLCLVVALSALLSPASGANAAPVITAPVNDNELVVLPGHLHPLAKARFDAGAVPGTMPMVELRWVIKHSAVQISAMNALMAAQQTRASPSYHQWLTPAQFGARFGASEGDLATAIAWLKSRGFEVGAVPAGRGYLPFSGTAAKVAAAFHTSIHYFVIDGEKHFANTAEPQVPSAFEPLISGISGLHDFRPKPGTHARIAHSAGAGLSRQPDDNNGGDENNVGPTDAAIIYDLLPAYRQKLTGTGMTIAVVAQSDIDTSIPTQYWTAFGVNEGQKITSIAVSPSTDPGRTGGGNEQEAYLDTEIIGGLAPNAQIILVRDKSAGSAAIYAIDNNIAPVLSVSFGSCEQQLGADNNSVSNSYQQAVMQGMTVIVSSGDAGVASCDDSTRDKQGVTVVSGLSVNGLASTPYNTAVGGTDFNGVLVDEGDYWNSNPPGTANAVSYIPEMVWNASCANPITAQLDTGSPNETPVAFCNDSKYAALDLILGGGGGVSSCISTDSDNNCVGGYPAPFWQTGLGYATRAIPDVAMLANNWVFCTEQQTCAAKGNIFIGSGTSAAAPAFAAIVLLKDQYQSSPNNPDGRQGNINPLLYLMEGYQVNSGYECSADLGASVGTSCVFHDVQTGNNDQPCAAATFAPSGSSPTSICTAVGSKYGLVALSGGGETFGAVAGYDLASGLGSVDASNFVFLDFSEPNSLGTGVNYAGGNYPNYTVWRPSTGFWYTVDGTGTTSAHQFGAPNDIPLVGDFDGDHVSDIAVWRPSNGFWYITQSSDGQVVSQQWGAPTDIPVAGDFDGDGRTDIAVWRPSTGTWYIIQSVDNQIVTKQFGEPTDIPLVGDFDGDGKSDIAVYRPSNGYWYVLQSSTGELISTQWGVSTDIPVIGDFDNDLKSDIAVYRPSTGYWYIIQSSNGQVLAKQWGQSGDVPASRDYDGDGATDIAVWRPSNGFWYVIQSSNGQVLEQQWGASSDIPINKSPEH